MNLQPLQGGCDSGGDYFAIFRGPLTNQKQTRIMVHILGTRVRQRQLWVTKSMRPLTTLSSCPE